MSCSFTVSIFLFFFCNDTATTEIYTYGHTLSLHDALPICRAAQHAAFRDAAEGRHRKRDAARAAHRVAAIKRKGECGLVLGKAGSEIGEPAFIQRCRHPEHELIAKRLDRGGHQCIDRTGVRQIRSEEHTSELQSLMRISYAVFCLKKKKTTNK